MDDNDRRKALNQQLEDRMAVLASRVVDPSERVRAYASLMLDRLWLMHDAIKAGF